jgi:translocon-associated protein subunit alpha
MRLFLLFLLVTPAVLTISQAGFFAMAEEDELVDDEEGVVEEEGEGDVEEPQEEAVEPEDDKKTTSADADTTILFTQPAGTSNLELPAGQITEFLVGFTNKGEGDMIVESLEASLRYPMDFTFHIQNFSSISYMKTVKPKQQASVFYSFIPADAFAGRPIGLIVNLAYRDSIGNFFIDPVFNETVQIVEFDEGFDTETFFMYVCLCGVIVLLLFLGFNFVSGSGKKKASARKAFETGTDKDDGVDYEWIPKSSLRTPGSGKTSPRQRKSKRGAGSDTE